MRVRSDGAWTSMTGGPAMSEDVLVLGDSMAALLPNIWCYVWVENLLNRDTMHFYIRQAE